MSRNYEVIHYIQDQLKEFDNNALTKSVTKLFEKLYNSMMHDACVYATVMLYVIFKYYRIDSTIVYGIAGYESKEYDYKFYHVWLEVNGKIVDLAIFGNINYSPRMLYMQLDKPIVNETYASAKEKNIIYKRYETDKNWKNCKIAVADNETIRQYCDNAPQNFWQHICSYLGIGGTPKNVNKLKELVGEEVIFSTEKGNN